MNSILLKLNKLPDRQKTYIALAVFAALILLFYGNTLGNDFVSDDTGQIRDNVYLRSLENLPKVITSCIWESANRGCYGPRTILSACPAEDPTSRKRAMAAPWG